MLERRILETDSPFETESGESFPSLRLAYYTSPREYTPKEKVVWVCHALTGNANPEDWWAGIVGPGKLFDPEKYYIVCVSMLGSPYGECSPASINPRTLKPYLLDFPKITVRDMVRAQNLVRKHIGIDRIELMLGPSIGGFQTAEWLVTYPDVVKRAVLLATSVSAYPYLTAFNESQRMAIRADKTFLEAKSIEGGAEGLKCARSIALISYRSPEGYNLTQQETDNEAIFADRAASYQRYQGEKLVKRGFDAYGYWYLSYALDSMNVGRGRGGQEKALSSVKAFCKVINISSDQIFPPEPMKEAARAIPHHTFEEIESRFGHDGFLVENDRLVESLTPLAEEICAE